MCLPGTFEAVSGDHYHHQPVSRRDFFRVGGAAGAAIAMAAALPTPRWRLTPVRPGRSSISPMSSGTGSPSTPCSPTPAG